VAHTGGAALLLFVLVGLLVRRVSIRSCLITASSGAAGHRAKSAMEDQNELPFPDFPRSRAIVDDRRMPGAAQTAEPQEP
ncbi:MAG: hypothetical protein ACREP0_11905, partial [Rhodanobacteraceae bacterium]